ncbi:MAG: hypothetical protein R2708_27210 [Vicinamibacterales bacterium]
MAKSQASPVPTLPAYIVPAPGMMSDKTAATPGLTGDGADGGAPVARSRPQCLQTIAAS